MDNTFKQDLIEGQWAEKLFVKVATEKLQCTDVQFNKSDKISELRKWDFRLTQKDVTKSFEVKWDKLSSETGNFAIEFFGRNSASGIEVTTADYWVILSDNQFFIFKTSELKKLIKDNPFRSLCIGNGTAYVYLVPIKQAKDIATIINL